MSNDFFWGLTVRNIENALWNGLSQDAMVFGGAAVAVIANALARSIIPNNHQGKAGGMKNLVCTLAGIAAGFYACHYYADRLPYVTFVFDNALKFAVISAVTGAIGLKAGWTGSAIVLITWGGACGYFGRDVLRAVGAIGAVAGSLYMSGIATKSP
jgi:hypothetical protein